MATASREEILEGPVLRIMARLGWPAMVFGLLNTFYNLADAFWIGHLPGGEAGASVAGIQASWPIVWFLISFAAGVGGAAVSALVSQYIGAGRYAEANTSLNQLLSLGLVLGAGLGILGFLWAAPLVRVLVPVGAVAGAATTYIRLIFLGLPFLFIPGLFYYALAATGDTLTPMFINGAGVVLNIVLDPFWIFGWGPFPREGIAGAACATLLSQGLTAAACLWVLYRGVGHLRLSWGELRPRLSWALKALRIGLPAGLGSSSVALGFVVLTGLIGRLPRAEMALAAYGIADRLLGILFVVSDGLSTGFTTMVGQALGAERFQRAGEVVRKGIFTLFLLLASEALALYLLRRPLVAIFIPGREDIIAEGARFIAIFSVGMPFLGIFFAASAVYRGAGHNVPTMVLGILRLWALRIPLSWLFGFALGWGSGGIWWGMTLSNIVAGLGALALLASGSWRRRVVD